MNLYKVNLEKNGMNITSTEEWRDIAAPKKADIHWKDGRSAKELAVYITGGNGYLPQEIEDVLSEIGCTVGTFFGEPEAVTQLKGKGEGRNHDLLLVRKLDTVIGIEAKVDESLGKIVNNNLYNSVSENKRNRIDDLYKKIYGKTYAVNPICIRYQLLTATVGTLIEAKNHGASNALLLIITFTKQGSPNKIATNSKDIDRFVQSLGSTLGNGQYNLPGFSNLDFYIKQINI